MSLRPRARYTLAAVALTALLAGCGSADNTTASKPAASRHGASSMAGMNMSSGSSMAGMNMAANSDVTTQVPSVNGIKPVASQVLATADWQGMRIQARTTTPTEFVVFDGKHEQTVKPSKSTSFHLMIMLSDQHTGVAIPYASVWATILKAGKVVYDEQQWPMLSAYMGPHYGNNVALPGPGHYQLKLQISPPVSARHMEYAHVWQKPHTVIESFSWKPSA
jgi:Fe2+ transport protein